MATLAFRQRFDTKICWLRVSFSFLGLTHSLATMYVFTIILPISSCKDILAQDGILPFDMKKGDRFDEKAELKVRISCVFCCCKYFAIVVINNTIILFSFKVKIRLRNVFHRLLRFPYKQIQQCHLHFLIPLTATLKS